MSRFNAHLDKVYTDVFAFIVAHDRLTAREDTPFWKSVEYETAIPAQLAARLDVFRRHLPTSFTKGRGEAWMFRDVSWFCVLLGMDFPFDVPAIGAGAVEETSTCWPPSAAWSIGSSRGCPDTTATCTTQGCVRRSETPQTWMTCGAAGRVAACGGPRQGVAMARSPAGAGPQ